MTLGSRAGSFTWIGDSALLFEDLSVAQRAALIRASHPRGVKDVVCGLTDAVVVLESPLCDSRPVLAWVRRLIQKSVTSSMPPGSSRCPTEQGTQHVFGVNYGGPQTDLAEVAVRLQMSQHEVVSRHARRAYLVLSTGFAPGFAYCGDLDDALTISRKTVPNPWVASGAVAMASHYTGVYPRLGAGGWWVLGHLKESADGSLWDFARRPPALLNVGDTVVFVAL